jgi:hypothetical protein
MKHKHCACCNKQIKSESNNRAVHLSTTIREQLIRHDSSFANDHDYIHNRCRTRIIKSIDINKSTINKRSYPRLIRLSHDITVQCNNLSIANDSSDQISMNSALQHTIYQI